MFDHVRTRAGWDNDIAARFFEDANRMLHDRTRFRAQAGVEVGLSATGLVVRKIHAHAEALKNVHDGLTSCSGRKN